MSLSSSVMILHSSTAVMSGFWHHLIVSVVRRLWKQIAKLLSNIRKEEKRPERPSQIWGWTFFLNIRSNKDYSTTSLVNAILFFLINLKFLIFSVHDPGKLSLNYGWRGKHQLSRNIKCHIFYYGCPDPLSTICIMRWDSVSANTNHCD